MTSELQRQLGKLTDELLERLQKEENIESKIWLANIVELANQLAYRLDSLENYDSFNS